MRKWSAAEFPHSFVPKTFRSTDIHNYTLVSRKFWQLYVETVKLIKKIFSKFFG
ncbi:Uncharacterized protein dnm_086550 [Desulfonema magnum]|uniref:Uncharacterized protein n=1 Tax=Desulfonema magnum TaxID=45655 RepID=A0A975BWB7_9BACT|nr:Uncharacterized protein dnm_086550 [Desulfonema magnum]